MVEVTVTQGKVQTANDRVELPRGEPARLVVTSDVEDDLHVHGGIGFEAELHAGQPTTLDVNFDEPGVYYVELHNSSHAAPSVHGPVTGPGMAINAANRGM